MAYKKIFCPNCGKETQIDENKEFCFCLECGNKIVVQRSKIQQIISPREQGVNVEEDNFVQKNNEIEEKLKEVKFYYQLSFDKKESYKEDAEPLYYLKAQDVLVDLSQKYPDDYRIWWELCKPVDFWCSSESSDDAGYYKINEQHFGKALDLAPLSEKRRLIEIHDSYMAEKAILKAEGDKRRDAWRLEEQQKRSEEERQRELFLEAERVRQEQLEKEQYAAFVKEKEKKQTELLNALSEKDHRLIDATYFQLQESKTVMITGVFRSISNVLYLISYRNDSTRGDTLYCDQTLSFKISENGTILKFDNKPLCIKGSQIYNDTLTIRIGDDLNLYLNDMKLVQNVEYVTKLMHTAKKPLIPFKKIFI